MKKSIFRIALFTLLVVSFVYACAPTVEAAPPHWHPPISASNTATRRMSAVNWRMASQDTYFNYPLPIVVAPIESKFGHHCQVAFGITVEVVSDA